MDFFRSRIFSHQAPTLKITMFLTEIKNIDFKILHAHDYNFDLVNFGKFSAQKSV